MAYDNTTVITQARLILNDPTPGYFWTDTDLGAWRDQGSLDVSVKGRCVEAMADLAFTSTGFSAKPTGLIGVESILRANGMALAKKRARQHGHGSGAIEGEPAEYSTFGTRIYVFPRPTASTTLTVLYWKSTLSFLDIPDAYQDLVIVFMLYRAKLKEEKYAAAAQLYDIYTQGLQYQRADLQDYVPDSREMLRMADRIIANS